MRAGIAVLTVALTAGSAGAALNAYLTIQADRGDVEVVALRHVKASGMPTGSGSTHSWW